MVKQRLGFMAIRRRRGLKQVIFPSRLRAKAGTIRIRRMVKQEVARSNDIELKFLDQAVDDGTVANAGTIFLNGSSEASLVRIPQDNTGSGRDGRVVTIKSIFWRMRIKLPATALETATSETVRILLYLDKQCNGDAPLVTDILASASFQAFNNLANKSRFRTLFDRTYGLSASAGSGQSGADEYGEVVINDTLFKKVNIPIEYNQTASTGAIATITSNNIGMLAISSDGTGSFNSIMRLRYSDV